MELVNYNYVLLFFCLIIICYFVILSVNLLLCLFISYSVQIKFYYSVIMSVSLLLCLFICSAVSQSAASPERCGWLSFQS